MAKKGKGRGWHGNSAGHSRAAKKSIGRSRGTARTPAGSLGAAAKQNRKLRSALRHKTIGHTNKTTTSKGRERMKQRIKANTNKYGAFKLASFGGRVVG